MIARHRWLGWNARRAALAAALLAWLCTTHVEAQGSAGAAKAFAQAQAAELAGQPEEAARFYELAHMLVPTAEALRSAARTRNEAGHRALAASHADALLRQYPTDVKSRAIAQSILDTTQGHLISVNIRCRVRCQIEVDGGATPAPASEEHVLYLEPGDHRLTATFEGEGSDTQVVSGAAGSRLSRSFEPSPKPEAPTQPSQPLESATAGTTPSSAPPPETSGRGRLPRAWFIGTAAVAVALAGTAVWSGMDVLNEHDVYKKRPTEARYEEGLDLERRTNILIGASSAVAVSAVVLAFFTRWSGDTEAPPEPSASVRVGVTSSGSSFTISQRF